MRDKLIRTGHKKAYYRMRAFGFAVLSICGASIVAAAPVAISYGTSYSQLAHAEEEKENKIEEVEENPSDSGVEEKA